jgi:hypothetical protein
MSNGNMFARPPQHPVANLSSLQFEFTECRLQEIFSVDAQPLCAIHSFFTGKSALPSTTGRRLTGRRLASCRKSVKRGVANEA